MWPRLNHASAGADELVLSADLDRLARAEFYDDLHRQHDAVGEVVVAGIFASLARDSFAMLPDAVRDGESGAVPAGPAPAGAGSLRGSVGCRTSYDAWAIAVDVERAATDRLVELLSRAKDVRVKQLLLGRVRETAMRAASHRMQRRAAYHAEKISEARVPFPDVRRIQDAGDLALVALAIEEWFLRLLSTRKDPSGAADNGARLTRATIARIKGGLYDRAKPRRLKKWLDRLECSTTPDKEQSGSESLWKLTLAAEASRVFDYYDRVFDNAELEEILCEAQTLSRDALRRLRSLREFA